MEPDEVELVEAPEQEVELEAPVAVETTPVAPAEPTDEQMQAWANQRGYSRQEAPVQTTTADPRMAQLEELDAAADEAQSAFDIPKASQLRAKARNMAMEIAADNASKSMMAQLAPLLAPVATNHFANEMSQGLPDGSARYIKEMLPKINMNDPASVQMAKDAAAFRATSQTAKLTNETSYSERPITLSQEEREEIAQLEKVEGRKFTAAEIRAARMVG
jgi:hypothetical protein